MEMRITKNIGVHISILLIIGFSMVIYMQQKPAVVVNSESFPKGTENRASSIQDPLPALTPEQVQKKMLLPYKEQRKYEETVGARVMIDDVRKSKQSELKDLQGAEEKFKALDARAEKLIKELQQGTE